MRQEDYNSMMRYPWERMEAKRTELLKCPSCGEKYCGNGVENCADCEKNNFFVFRALGFELVDCALLSEGQHCFVNWGIYGK